MLNKELLQQAIKDYLENYSIESNHSPRTIRNKRGCYNRFLQWLGDRPYSFETVREYLLHLNERGLKPNSILDEVRMFRALTNFLFKRKYINESFADEIAKPKVPPKDFPDISQEMVEKIIEAGVEIGLGDRSRSKFYKEEARLALHFILRTGLRINELIQLKGSDLNLFGDPPSYRVHSKGGSVEWLPLPLDMIDILQKRLEYPRLFVTSEKLCNTVLTRGIKRLGIMVNTKLTCHTLRHIYATNLVRNKVTPQFLARLMRHSSVEVTNKYYTHLNLSDLSLIVNSTQSVVREGLKENEVFEMILKSVKSTGVNKDNRYVMKTETKEGLLQIIIRAKNKIN